MHRLLACHGAVTCVRWVLTYAGHVCVAFVAQNELQFYRKMEKKETVKKMKKIFGRLFSPKKILQTQMKMYVWWVWLCEVEYRLECEVEGQCIRCI